MKSDNIDIRTISISVDNLRSDDKGMPTMLVGTPIVYSSRSQKLCDYFVEVFEPRSFTEWLATSPDIYACCHHDDRQLMGRTDSGTLRIKEDERGVHIECDIPQTTYAQDMVNLIHRKDIKGMSFGFVGVDEEWRKEDGLAVRVITKARLYEVSFVTNPAYLSTSAGVRSKRSLYAADDTITPASYHRLRKLKLLEMQHKVKA